VRLIAPHNHARLPRGPVRCRMLRHVPMQDSSGADVQDDEHVDHEGGRTTTKKSLAGTARAWFRTKVLHVCVPRLARGGPDGIYRLTVRGETRTGSFTRSSAAIRSSPHVRFAAAMVGTSCRRSAGIGERPGTLDFQRQNTLNSFRCQRVSVSSLTIVSRRRHSTKCYKATKRDAGRIVGAGRDVTCRSRYTPTAF
jgi:hypothetical protein